MKRVRGTAVVGLAALCCLCLLCSTPGFAGSEKNTHIDSLLSVGRIGDNPVELKVRTNKPEDQKFTPGDNVVIHLSTDRDAYVTAVYISAKGDGIVLFPNSESPDNLVKAGEEVTLFGSSSGIRLKVSPKTEGSKIVFFASARPLDPEPLKASAATGCIFIPAAAEKEIDILTKKVASLSQDSSFNRVILSLTTASEKGVSLNLMGLPVNVKSDKPETVVGVQGVRGTVETSNQ